MSCCRRIIITFYIRTLHHLGTFSHARHFPWTRLYQQGYQAGYQAEDAAVFYDSLSHC